MKKNCFRILNDSPVWTDRRLVENRFMEFAFEAVVPQSVEEHRARREEAIRQVRLAAGLEPMIGFSAEPPQVGNRRNWHGVAIFDVEIQTLPGLRLTGNLMMPEKISEPLPGILSPHGHWKQGRVDQEPLGSPAMRAFQLARLGFVVFAYDMVGYNDNNDLPHTFDPELRQRGDLAGVSVFGLQTANGLRAAEFLANLPEVDASRLGCTGASGGGSQTWFLSLLEPRIKAAAPVCMLSSHFQGGCPCEEGPLLRSRGLTSFDILAALAPTPLLLPAVTGDWTNLNPDYEVPRLKQVYALYHAESEIENFYAENVHNYNQFTRERVYAWFLRKLKGRDCGESVAETELPAPPPELLWHGGKPPVPASGARAKRTLKILEKHYTGKALDFGNDFPAWQRRNTGLLRQLIGSDTPTRDVAWRLKKCDLELPHGKADAYVASRRNRGDVLPLLLFKPEKTEKAKAGFLMLSPGRTEEFLKGGALFAGVDAMMKKGLPGIGIELLGSGETAEMLKYSTRDTNPRLANAFEMPLFAMRVQDIITAYVLMQERGFSEITLIAPPGTAPEALAAAALLGKVPAVFDLEGVDDTVWEQPLTTLPLVGKLGGLAGLALLNSNSLTTFCRPSGMLQKLLKKHSGTISLESWRTKI